MKRDRENPLHTYEPSMNPGWTCGEGGQEGMPIQVLATPPLLQMEQ